MKVLNLYPSIKNERNVLRPVDMDASIVYPFGLRNAVLQQCLDACKRMHGRMQRPGGFADG